MLTLHPGKSSLTRSRSPFLAPPTKELEESLSTFEKALSEERRKQFQLLRSTDDSYDANAAQILLANVKKEKDSRRRSRALLKIQGFLEAVQEFSAIVDSIAGINPIAGAVWGGVKLFIVYAIKFTHFTDDLTTCLNQVQDVCPRFKAYGTLYQSSQELKKAICDYYAVVFRFITRAISELDKSGLSAAWSYIKSPLKSVLSEFKDDLTRSGENVNLYTVFAKSQADAAAQEDVQKHNNSVKKAWDQLLKREQDQRLVKERNSARSQRHELLKRLSDHEYKRLPKDLRKKALYGPDGPWLLKTSQYRSWATVQDSAIFLLSGKLGSGKSVLSTEVLDDLLVQYSSTPKMVICFFFCDARQQKESSLLARTILGCLCRQYLQQCGDLDTVEPALSDFFEENSSPDAEEIADFFASCVHGSTTTLFILDGLDDCNSHERTIVLTALGDIMSQGRQSNFDQSKNIKLFITFSLADDTQLSRFLRADYQQHTTSSEASHDFARAIDRLLEEKKEKGIWKFRDEGLFLDITHALHEGSQNMLLWASLMIDEICAQHRITDVRNMIQEDRLPKDLHEVYDLALGRIMQTHCQDYAARMFNAVAAARRPMSLLEMAEVVVIEPCQPSWNPEDRIAVPEEMMSWVANLLVLDEEDKTIAFTHHSVVNFLTQTQSSIFQLDLKEADIVLGKICVTYLNFRELQGQLVLRQEVRSRPQLHPMHLASTAISSAGGNQSWTKLLTKMVSKTRHDNQQRRFNSPGAKSIETLKAELQQLQSVFYLLAYASEFWLDHSSEFDKDLDDQTRILDLWKLLLVSPIAAAARPWDPEPWNISFRSWQYALDRQHAALFTSIWNEKKPGLDDVMSRTIANILFKSYAMHRPKDIPLWQIDEFWKMDWDKVLEASDAWRVFSALKRDQAHGSLTNYDPSGETSKNGLLLRFESMALLGSITNEHIWLDVLNFIALRGLPLVLEFNLLSVAAAYNNARFIELYHRSGDRGTDNSTLETSFRLLQHRGNQYGSLKEVQDLNPPQEAGQALVVAALRGSIESCAKLLEIHQTRTIPNEFHQVALIIASRRGDLEIARLLLGYGQAVEYPRTFIFDRPVVWTLGLRGLTALMTAAIGDHEEMVELLLSNGAPKDPVDRDKKTALMHAKSEGIRRRLTPKNQHQWNQIRRQLNMER